MKKRYESPTVQLMTFRYRDQVVAASGISAQNEEYPDAPAYPDYGSHDWNKIIGEIIEALRQLFG